MIYYVDIDETICFYEDERDYPKAKPIPENIEIINRLYDEGHTVVYWTARGTVTGLDWTKLTHNQLKQWGAKYTDVRLGKLREQYTYYWRFWYAGKRFSKVSSRCCVYIIKRL